VDPVKPAEPDTGDVTYDYRRRGNVQRVVRRRERPFRFLGLGLAVWLGVIAPAAFVVSWTVSELLGNGGR
jgi:hypothetical protein